ncbi:YncE family protein [Streptomyces sp. NPDC051577]|uniref:YncE family protein n=1 Tax=Streptomyces sp. NPDC051577 TaxID=3155166 RepID=UPI00343E2ECA
MEAVVLSCDTAAGRLTLTDKSGLSSYRRRGAVVTGRGPLAAVQCEAGGEVFVSVSVGEEIFVVDASASAVTGRIRAGWAPRSLTPVPGTPYLLVANAGADSVSVIDTQERAEAARIAVGREPGQIAVTEGGALALVCERGEAAVTVLDLSPLARGRPGRISVAARTRLGAHIQPRAAAVSEGFALVTAARSDRLFVLRLDGTGIETTLPLPVKDACPAGAAVLGEGGYALVALERAGSLAVIDLLEWTLTRQIPVGAGPRGITIDPADRTVYCALAHESAVAVVHLDGVDLSNTDGHPQHETIPAGPRPTAVALAHGL